MSFRQKGLDESRSGIRVEAGAESGLKPSVSRAQPENVTSYFKTESGPRVAQGPHRPLRVPLPLRSLRGPDVGRAGRVGPRRTRPLGESAQSGTEADVEDLRPGVVEISRGAGGPESNIKSLEDEVRLLRPVGRGACPVLNLRSRVKTPLRPAQSWPGSFEFGLPLPSPPGTRGRG